MTADMRNDGNRKTSIELNTTAAEVSSKAAQYGTNVRYNYSRKEHRVAIKLMIKISIFLGVTLCNLLYGQYSCDTGSLKSILQMDKI